MEKIGAAELRKGCAVFHWNRASSGGIQALRKNSPGISFYSERMAILQDAKLNFAPRLRALCGEADSISKVARDLRINRQQFARYLNGSTFPRPPVLAKMAAYFGVEVADLFTTPTGPANPETFRALPALTEVLTRSGLSDPSDSDIEPGFYLMYKRSFRYGGRIFVALAQVSRDARGVLRFRRRTSPRYLNQLPGADAGNEFRGVFVRHDEHLVMFNYATVTPALTVFAFMPSLHFDRSIKPGIHMMMGTIGQRRPMVSRVFLEQVKGGCGAVLAAARQQGFYDDAEMSRRTLALLDTPPYSAPHQFGIDV